MNSTSRGLSEASLHAPGLWGRLGRGALALGIAASLSLPAVATSVDIAVAQEASAGVAAAEISPADSIFYLGLSLDIESPQWVLANELLARAGAEEDATGLLDDLTESTGGTEMGGVSATEAILGGEAAIVVTTLDTVAEQAGGLTEIVGELDIPTEDIATDAIGGFALVVQPSDLSAATQQIDDEMTADSAASGDPVEEVIYNGTAIKSLPADEMTGDTGMAYAVVGDFIVVAEAATDVEPFIDTAAGTLDSLAGVPAFQQANEALAGERLAFAFIDGTNATADISGLATEEEDLAMFGFLQGMTGLAVYSGLSVVADDAGFRFNGVEIPADGSTVEAGGTAADLGFADSVPADTLIFVNGYNLGQGELLQGLGLFLVSAFATGLSGSDATPAAIPNPDELYGQVAALLGFNLKTDFIDQMVGEYGFALWNVDLADPTQIAAVLKSEVDAPAILIDSLAKLSLLVQAAAQGEASVTTKTVADSRVSSVSIGEDPATSITIDYGVVSDEFLLSVGGGLDTYLAPAGDTLSSDADFQDALAALPAEYDGIFYVNVADAIELAMSAEGDLGMGMDSGDASEACAEFSSQAAAQEAYEADTIENFDLDLDFDGEACEDYFAAPEATPVADASAGEFAGIRSFATVSYKEDGLAYTSSILLIAEAE